MRALVAVVVLIGAVAGIVFLIQSAPEQPFLKVPPAALSETVYEPAPAEGSASDYRYTNERYGFSLSYPKDLTVWEYDEGEGAMTVTFENADGSLGFQIFIVPYESSQITQERFNKDTPSGIMEDPVEIVIGGAPATMFFSEHALLGQTREVWFIHGGRLFEVSTFRELDSWLAEIMRTWEFL